MATDREVLNRSEMDSRFMWRLEDIFKIDSDWESDYQKAEKLVDEAVKYAGRFSEGAKVFLEALNFLNNMELSVERLFVYARMRRDEDNQNTKYQGMADRAMALIVKAQSQTAFLTPEILSIPQNIIDAYFTDEPKLETYRQVIAEINHKREHTLNESEERLLAMTGEITEAPHTIYSMMCDADMTYPIIKDEDGNDVEITHGRFIPLMESKNREVRINTFNGLYTTYKKWANTIAATYSSSVKTDMYHAKARKYGSSLEASLHPDNVPQSVYDSLIEAVHGALPAMHRYVSLKKRVLGLSEMHMYDLYVPIVKDTDIKITYDEARDLVSDGLAPLGKEYVGIMRDGITKGGWVDVYENKGKTAGAYSWGVWGSHPFVLLNWNDTVDNAFTLAHELGHAMHSYYSDTAQAYHNAQYPILLAEVASTCNEAVFMDYMLKKYPQKNERMYLQNYFLEQFRTTVFRQVMFAEFEKIAHGMAEGGNALTPDSLNEAYFDLNKKYYGPDMVVDDLIALEWSRIPHFYRAFYVYKYATGFSSAIALSRMLLSGGDAERERYLTLLSGGRTKFPLQLLRDAGVDLTTPDAVAGALKSFDETLCEMEELL